MNNKQLIEASGFDFVKAAKAFDVDVDPARLTTSALPGRGFVLAAIPVLPRAQADRNAASHLCRSKVHVHVRGGLRSRTGRSS
jgi:hypothetical protein